MKFKNLLIPTIGIFSFSIITPVALTSCNETNNDSKSIELIANLDRYKSFEYQNYGATFGFDGRLKNNQLKNKTAEQAKKYLNIKDDFDSSISSFYFSKLIDGIDFYNTDLNGSYLEILPFVDINSSSLDNRNISTSTMITDMNGLSIAVFVSLNNGASWSNGSKDAIIFSITEN